MLTTNSCVLILLIGINSLADRASCIKCYVCDITNCSNFNNSNKNYYEKQCSPTQVGCLFQKSENIVISRSCEEYNGTVCLTINDVENCFCSSNLCNSFSYIAESDDEELTVEGSGTDQPEDDLIEERESNKESSATVIKSVVVLICTFTWLV